MGGCQSGEADELDVEEGGSDASTPAPVILISDPGQDLDDEMALMMSRFLVHKKLLDLRGVVVTLHPAFDRARLCRGTLDILGLFDVPVGVGSDGGDVKHQHKGSTFEHWASGYMPTGESERATHIQPGGLLLFQLYVQAEPKSLSLVIIASLKDPALFLRDNEDLFARKTRQVVIMGGVEKWDSSTSVEDIVLTPDSAHNQSFDKEASAFFYRRCQELQVPLVVVSRWSAYAAKVPRRIYDDLASMGSSIGCRLRNAQRSSIESLWLRACSAEGDPQREGLPARCDRQWFLKTFCDDSEAGKERGADDSIWDLVAGFMQYDTVALLAAIPKLREDLFEASPVKGLAGVEHLIIGRSEEKHDVRKPEALLEFMKLGFQQGLALNHRRKRQFILLSQPLWDDVTDELLACTLLKTLYSIGLLSVVGIIVSGPVQPQSSQNPNFDSLTKIKEVLAQLGLSNIPVHFSAYASKDMNDKLKQLYEKVGPAGASLVVTGCLGSVLNFAKANRETFQEKTQIVVHAGGARLESNIRKSTLTREQILVPDLEAQANLHDKQASIDFYHMMQTSFLVPMRIISRHCIQELKMPTELFAELQSRGGSVGSMLHEARTAYVQRLWEVARDKLEAPNPSATLAINRAGFLARYCAEGYLEHHGRDIPPMNSILIYTSLAILAAFPQVFNHGFNCQEADVRSIRHHIVGADKMDSGVRDVNFLHSLMYQCFFKGCFGNASEFPTQEAAAVKLQESSDYWRYDKDDKNLQWLRETGNRSPVIGQI